MAINTNLYPPIVSTYVPAFLKSPGVCKLYFSISQYNSFEDIKHAQVTIKNQNSNLSVLSKAKYPCEIMLKEIKQENGKYYIEITKEDISGGEFELNLYYKVQIRFTSVDATYVSLNVPQAIDSWLTTNQSSFSEWSSVCLIRAISTPDLELTGWDIQSNKLTWSNTSNTLTGKLVFADAAETETLKSYRVVLKDDSGNILTDSGLLYSNTFSDVNTFTYTFKYNFEVGNFYSYEIEYTTMNLYTDRTALDLFEVIQESDLTVDATISTYADQEDGCIVVTIDKPESAIRFTGDVYIRRMDVKTNIWEDVYAFTDFNSVSKFTKEWKDYSIESGCEYLYCIQIVDNTTNKRGGIVVAAEPSIVILDDIFITTAERNLKIEYNPNVSSFKRTIMESKTDTIGSQYPFFKRNGHTNYAQFPIGGLIVADDNIGFLNLAPYSVMGNGGNAVISDAAYDFIKEREYRKEILEFLQSDNIKLFRSTPEGNLLIKIMDVSLSPMNGLGRKIWSFTATAYEVDECTVENFKKYNIIAEGSDK